MRTLEVGLRIGGILGVSGLSCRYQQVLLRLIVQKSVRKGRYGDGRRRRRKVTECREVRGERGVYRRDIAG